jgi:hypothetical protein
LIHSVNIAVEGSGALIHFQTSSQLITSASHEMNALRWQTKKILAIGYRIAVRQIRSQTAGSDLLPVR